MSLDFTDAPGGSRVARTPHRFYRIRPVEDGAELTVLGGTTLATLTSKVVLDDADEAEAVAAEYERLGPRHLGKTTRLSEAVRNVRRGTGGPA